MYPDILEDTKPIYTAFVIESLYCCILINLAAFGPMFPTDLQWLHHDKNAFLMQKDCINGYIGGIQPDGSNLVEDWVKKNNVQTVFLFSFTYVIIYLLAFCILQMEGKGLMDNEWLMWTDASSWNMHRCMCAGLRGYCVICKKSWYFVTTGRSPCVH